MNENEDVVVTVTLRMKDYKVLRELIDERQALVGLKRWLSTRIFWAAGGILSVLGVIEFLRRFGS